MTINFLKLDLFNGFSQIIIRIGKLLPAGFIIYIFFEKVAYFSMFIKFNLGLDGLKHILCCVNCLTLLGKSHLPGMSHFNEGFNYRTYP